MGIRFDKDKAEYAEISTPYSGELWCSCFVVWDIPLSQEERDAAMRGEEVRPEHVVYIDGERVP